jgi:hypothetical protein
MNVFAEIIKIEFVSNESGSKRYLVDLMLYFEYENNIAKTPNNTAEFVIIGRNISYVYELAKTDKFLLTEFLKYAEL